MTLKRSLDLGLSIAGLLLIWPILAVIGVLVKAGDGGAVFFRQERIGRYGRPFRIWKFRTMTPAVRDTHLQLTVGADARITRTGAWLRRTKLDELPQLFNVIAGDMSLVGPRPEVPKYVSLYAPAQRRVLELQPGITDSASIIFADESELLAAASDPERFYVDSLIPEKIRLNLEYAQRASTLRDLAVVFKTFERVLPRFGLNSARFRAVADPAGALGAKSIKHLRNEELKL